MQKRITRLAALAVTTLMVVGVAQAELFGPHGIIAPTGVNPATDSNWAPGDAYRLVFITSTTTNAVSEDIGYYNTFVNAAADLSILRGVADTTWNALASTAAVDAAVNTNTTYEELHPGDPVYLLDGSTLVAEDFETMWTAIVIPQPILLTESAERDFDITWTGSCQYIPNDWANFPLGTPEGPTWGNPNQRWAGKPYAWISYWQDTPTNEYRMYAMSETLIIALPGDADSDGDVDAADYIALKANLGQAADATWADGDFNYDGDVDWDDLQILQAHYGETIAGAAGSIPEPATLCLLAFGEVAVIRRRRRA